MMYLGDELAAAERWIECPRCDGFGANEDEWDYIECHRCHGTGEVLR